MVNYLKLCEISFSPQCREIDLGVTVEVLRGRGGLSDDGKNPWVVFLDVISGMSAVHVSVIPYHQWNWVVELDLAIKRAPLVLAVYGGVEYHHTRWCPVMDQHTSPLPLPALSKHQLGAVFGGILVVPFLSFPRRWLHSFS